ncbi:hypothetical protein P153DRAFT_119975 [Dothidotthia symphoricarpi CBS 119687]|uniref:Uncharacterized protein n=1 Tax=Dothidotthia symphoricarpi CBS 119687 TaxID=1392245 RepID=A0A6A6A0L9_9PLEO|nr:uncharacterized protein P153DRAFT_119975 [Dothidotthia symphoricarpi CBS 119687]KAF2125076.1 hypothetical protein P153DRAFT_119975 [Dothidotthia symphoricarpi CBS 119687]
MFETYQSHGPAQRRPLKASSGPRSAELPRQRSAGARSLFATVAAWAARLSVRGPEPANNAWRQACYDKSCGDCWPRRAHGHSMQVRFIRLAGRIVGVPPLLSSEPCIKVHAARLLFSRYPLLLLPSPSRLSHTVTWYSILCWSFDSRAKTGA